MLVKELLAETKKKMDHAVESTHREFGGVRTGRASTALLDGIQVHAYGTQSPLKQVANLSTPDARTIVIQPWDRGLIKEIEKAIQASDLGITPNSDGAVIRLAMPQPTQERRKELAKHVKKLGEDGKVSLRNIRRHAIDEIKAGEKDGDIPEDDGKKARVDIDKKLEGHVTEIDALVKEKTDEILNF